MKIALVTCAEAASIDEDLAPLAAALEARGADVELVDWRSDDALERFDTIVLRSTWDYADRRDEFVAWAAYAADAARLLNPYDVVVWNTDKHYLADLADAGVDVIPTAFVEPGADEWALPDSGEVVVKPAVGAGSRDAARYGRHDEAAIDAHITRLLGQRRAVMIQPYLADVDEAGESALVYFAGALSHAIRKGPLLRRGAAPVEELFAAEDVTAHEPSSDERALAEDVLAAVPHPGPMTYARVDIVRESARPLLLELELVEPSVFHRFDPGSADRFARAILDAG